MLKATLTALVVTATPLTAETDHCKQMGDMAAQIMEAREVGVPLSSMMDIAADNDLLKALILSAYQVPRFSTGDYRQEAITDFRNEVEVMCYGDGA